MHQSLQLCNGTQTHIGISWEHAHVLLQGGAAASWIVYVLEVVIVGAGLRRVRNGVLTNEQELVAEIVRPVFRNDPS